MKKLICQSLVTCLVTILFLACKKESNSPEVQPPAEVRFSAEGLVYIQLPLNFYLIYKDSASSVEDSIIVTRSLLETKLSPEKSGNSYDGFTFHDRAYYYNIFSLILFKANSPSSIWFSGKADGKKSSAWGIVSTNDDIINMLDADNSGAFYFPAPTVIEQYMVEGVAYSKVIQISSWNGFEETDPRLIKQTFYWAKGIGIIKWQKVTGNEKQTYTLLRHS